MIVADEIVLEQPAHIYREVATKIVRPSVTQILKAKGWIDDTWFKNNEFARDRGSAAHLAIHFLEKGTLDPFTVSPVIEPYVASYELFKRTTGYRVLYHEKLLFHPQFFYCGSLDSVGILNGEEVIIDFKTGDVKEWAGLQLAAYNACLPPTASGRVRKRFGLRLYGDGSIARLKPFEDHQDEQTFLSEVNGYYAMLKKGLIQHAA